MLRRCGAAGKSSMRETRGIKQIAGSAVLVLYCLAAGNKVRALGAGVTKIFYAYSSLRTRKM